MTYKVVWSNGDEVYVKAPCASDARRVAAELHGPTAARVVYCEPYA